AKPAFSSATSATSFLQKSACASADSEVIAGSTNFRHTEVLERSAGSLARKSIHGVFAFQSASTLVLASARANSAFNPPIDLAQFSASRQSSTQSIDGVL